MPSPNTASSGCDPLPITRPRHAVNTRHALPIRYTALFSWDVCQSVVVLEPLENKQGINGQCLCACPTPRKRVGTPGTSPAVPALNRTVQGRIGSGILGDLDLNAGTAGDFH
jgi:hypothetical protein